MLDAAARLQYGMTIKREVAEHFPELTRDIPHGELIIHAQIWQESRWNAAAQSPAGARGLLQLMPATDHDIDGDYDGFDAEGNIDNGVRYLSFLYSRFGEIPDPRERLRFALASYNCGRGYINKALEIARLRDSLPGNYNLWLRAGRPSGKWQLWCFAYPCLNDPRCQVRGRRPVYKEVTDYVHKIMMRYAQYVQEVS